MIEVKELPLYAARAETYPCRLCKEMVKELFICDSCGAKICGDCFLPHEVNHLPVQGKGLGNSHAGRRERLDQCSKAVA